MKAIFGAIALAFIAAPAFAGTSAVNSYVTENGHGTIKSNSTFSNTTTKVQDNISTSLKQECEIPGGTAGYNRCSYSGSIGIGGFSGNQNGVAQVDPVSIQSGSYQREHVVSVSQSAGSESSIYKFDRHVFTHEQSSDAF
jgi:hypothetical protein